MKSLLSIITISMIVTGCALLAPKPATTTPSKTNDTIKTPTTPPVLAPVVAEVDEIEPPLHRDINNDGVIDSVFIDNDGGSIYGGSYLTMFDGKTKNKYSTDNADFYEAVISIYAVNINEPSFAKAAQELLLPKESRQSLDPLGSWVVRANYNKRIYKNNPHFDMVSKPKLVWGNDKSISPTDYCVKVTADKAREYLQYRSVHQYEDFAASGTIPEKCNSVWMIYYGYRFCEEPMKEVGRSGKTAVYANNECVGVEREGKFAWLFVNDGCLFGRTRTGIESLEVKDGLIFLELNAPTYVIVDIKTGKLASLKPYSEEYPYDDNDNIKQSIINAFKAL